ncbi:hypothetical protein AB0F96_09785 [Streptomyces sp. NPDC023998]
MSHRLRHHTAEPPHCARPARLKRMQHRPGLVDGYIAKTGLDFAPP